MNSQGFVSHRRLSKITPATPRNGVKSSELRKSIFLGGGLMITIVQAEKIFGSGRVFGRGGKYKSYVHVSCGNKQIAKSVIEDGVVSLTNSRWTWAGFDSNFRIMDITPALASVVRILVYDCDRTDVNTPLGVVNVPLQYVCNSAEPDYNCILPIEHYNKFGFPTAQGSVMMNITFSPYYGSNISRFGEHPTDVSKMKTTLSFGVGWDLKQLGGVASTYEYGASLVMFNASGGFIDAVDARKKKSRKGPPATYDSVLTHDGFMCDKEQFSVDLKHRNQQSVFAYFLVLCARTEAATLQDLQNVYVRVLDGKSKKEDCRYDVDIAASTLPSSTACVAARITKNPNNRKVSTSTMNIINK
jgi:stress response protein SCP2